MVKPKTAVTIGMENDPRSFLLQPLFQAYFNKYFDQTVSEEIYNVMFQYGWEYGCYCASINGTLEEKGITGYLREWQWDHKME